MREKERGKGGVGYISCELDKSRQERWSQVSQLLKESFYHFPLLQISHIFFIPLWVDVVEKLFSAPRARARGVPRPSLVVGLRESVATPPQCVMEKGHGAPCDRAPRGTK